MNTQDQSAQGGGTIQRWIDRYHADHNHPLNHLTHFIGIPAIVVSLVVVFFNWKWGLGPAGRTRRREGGEKQLDQSSTTASEVAAS